MTDQTCVGYQPQVAVAAADGYWKGIYEKMWAYAEYRAVAPGESTAMTFLAQARPKPGSSVIDYGAGTGRGALMLALLGGLKVQMLDFASNCLDEEVAQALITQSHALSFTLHDLVLPVPLSSPYGYCTDVMEHIPPEQVDRVLCNILRSSEHVFFQIACEDDVCGKLIGQSLHVSVHPYAWWLRKLQDFDCVVHWSQDCGSHCLFYVTAWQQAKTFVDHGVLNVDEEKLLDNVRVNVRNAEWRQVTPHETNDVEVAILCGGPSLNDYVEEIEGLKATGTKIVTLNGTYLWAQEHGLWPVTQIVVDGRPFNARFTHPVDTRNLYLIASQVDPSVLAGLPLDRTLLWHTNTNNEKMKEILDERYPTWYNTPGGSTVLLRAIPLLRMLGFKRFTLYGADSCLMNDAHHAYAQPENDDAIIINVTCGDRMFKCFPWQASQASELMDLIRFLGEEIELDVRGDGLIAHILNTGARMADEDVLLP